MNGIRLHSAAGRGVVLTAVLGSGVAFLDSTVVNVALPTLERDLQAGLSGLQWTVDAYLLTLGSLLLVGGALGDQHGRRPIFILGLVWFALASALCGVAPEVVSLIIARGFQGMGAALLVPGSLAIIRSTFHSDDQAQAVGLWAGLSGVTTAIGPLLGGVLVEVSWRLIFFINLPLAAIGVWAALRFVPHVPKGERVPIDVGGAASAALGLAGVVFALIEGPVLGFTHQTVLLAAGTGLALLTTFVAIEARRRHPMLPLGVFRSRQFFGANVTTLVVYFALGGVTFLLMIQLQKVLGFSPLMAGASLTPITLLLLLLSPAAGKLGARHGHRLFMTAGPLLAAVGVALLSMARPGFSYWLGVLPGVLVLGLGLSATVAPLTSAMLEGVSPSLAGVASGVNNAVARIAGLLAVALLPAVAGMGAGTLTNPSRFSSGYAQAMWWSAGLCAIGGVVAFFTIERGPQIRS